MNTTIDKLNGLKNTKQAIKQAIINKGVAVDEAATFASYANKIGEIQTGGGGNIGLPQITTYPDKKFRSVGSNAWLFDQIKSIDWTEFNKLGFINLQSMFQNWSGDSLDIQNLDTSSVINMRYMFYGCFCNELNLTNLNTEKVTEMDHMFANCSKLSSIDISTFNTTNNTSFAQMFSGCSKLTTVNLKNINTSSVKSFYEMFSGCQLLQTIDVSNLDISSATSIKSMFGQCDSLETIDLSNFNTTNITDSDDMYSGLFWGCKKIKNVTWGNNWMPNPAVKLLNYAGNSYRKTTTFSHDTILDLFNKLATRDNTPEIQLADVVYDLMTPDELAIAQNKGWTVTRV